MSLVFASWTTVSWYWLLSAVSDILATLKHTKSLKPPLFDITLNILVET